MQDLKMQDLLGLNKLGLKEDYQNQDDIKDIVRCLFGLPLLPAEDIRNALQTIRAMICTDMRMARQLLLQQLMTYVQRQWIDRRTVGPDRLSVCDIRWRTNNVLETRATTQLFVVAFRSAYHH